MLGNTMRSPSALVAAPVSTPTPADKAAQPDVAAHPFAEMLRQNRLAEAPAAAGPKAATAADSKSPSTSAHADEASPTAPAAPLASRDAAQARARAATASHTPAHPTMPAARATTAAADGPHEQKDSAASSAASSDTNTTAATTATISPPALAARSDAVPGAANASAANGTQAGNAADVDSSALPGTSAGITDARRETVSTTADAATRAAANTSDGPLRDAAPTFAEALAEAGTAHRADAASSVAEHSHATVASAAAATTLAEPTRTAAPAADTPVVTSTVPVPVDSPDFPAAFGLHVSTLARDGVQRAELHLNPSDMGPVSIQITLDGTQARVDFGADVAATRHAIEAGLPELASALRDAGFTLAGGGVAQHSRSSGGQADDAGAGDTGSRRSAPATVARLDAAAQRATRRDTAGGVDVYA